MEHADIATTLGTADQGVTATEGISALHTAIAAFNELQDEIIEERMRSRELADRLLDAHQAAERERRRAETLFSSIKLLHRSLYAGTTSEHILRASMDVTDAERGYFLADTGDGLRVRAAIDVPARVGDRPSPFISAIAQRVLNGNEPLTWTEEAPPALLEPGPHEHFRRGLAVPVSTLGAPTGVIIALDRDGEFHDTEVRSLLHVGTQAGVAVENARLRDEVQSTYLATISLLADAVQAKDPYTHGHCERVSHYARSAAKRLGLSEHDTRVTCFTALLHDVGKIGVSDGVLNKPGPLIAEERTLVEAHVRIGYDLLTTVPALREIALTVLRHHEWYDGNGYPDGFAGDDIPIASRIVAVVDAYCAMIDKRSYKEALSHEHAVSELRRCAGTQFDPLVVDAVIDAIHEVDSAAEAGAPVSASCGLLPPPPQIAP